MPKEDTQFKPGQSGNPGGRPKGARTRLTGDFLNALADDFEQHGKGAIEACRVNKPEAYMKAIVQLCPKQVEVERPLNELSDSDLAAAIGFLRNLIASSDTEGAGSGSGPETGGEPSGGVPPIH